MPLVSATLKAQLSSAFGGGSSIATKEQGSPPNVHSEAARLIASAYDSWIKLSVPAAGALVISAPGVMGSLVSSLRASRLVGFEAGLIAYWAPVMWSGPGFIPMNPTDTSGLVGLSAEIESFVSSDQKPSSVDDAAGKLSDILCKYTQRLNVIATTTTTPPVVSSIPVI